MHTVFALLCFVVVIHWLIFPYPSGLLHWHCGNLTIAPVPAKQPWWIWINTSCEFIMNDCITTTKQSTTKPCAYFLGYTVQSSAVLHQHRRRPVPHYNDVIMSAMASQITGDRRFPGTKGQWRGKCFHLMTSSWITTGNEKCYILLHISWKSRILFTILLVWRPSPYTITTYSSFEFKWMLTHLPNCLIGNVDQETTKQNIRLTKFNHLMDGSM